MIPSAYLMGFAYFAISTLLYMYQGVCIIVHVVRIVIDIQAK